MINFKNKIAQTNNISKKKTSMNHKIYNQIMDQNNQNNSSMRNNRIWKMNNYCWFKMIKKIHENY